MDFVALQASGLETRYAAYELSLTGVTALEPPTFGLAAPAIAGLGLAYRCKPG